MSRQFFQHFQAYVKDTEAPDRTQWWTDPDQRPFICPKHTPISKGSRSHIWGVGFRSWSTSLQWIGKLMKAKRRLKPSLCFHFISWGQWRHSASGRIGTPWSSGERPRRKAFNEGLLQFHQGLAWFCCHVPAKWILFVCSTGKPTGFDGVRLRSDSQAWKLSNHF